MRPRCALRPPHASSRDRSAGPSGRCRTIGGGSACRREVVPGSVPTSRGRVQRSEEHTSELQSPYDLVCRLLLEKKKKTQIDPQSKNLIKENNSRYCQTVAAQNA